MIFVCEFVILTSSLNAFSNRYLIIMCIHLNKTIIVGSCNKNFIDQLKCRNCIEQKHLKTSVIYVLEVRFRQSLPLAHLNYAEGDLEPHRSLIFDIWNTFLGLTNICLFY